MDKKKILLCYLLFLAFSIIQSNIIACDSFYQNYSKIIPIIKNDNSIFFLDPFISRKENSILLGYRKFSMEKKLLFGIYCSYDLSMGDKDIRKQISLGYEAWVNKIFINNNFYMPFGGRKNFNGEGNFILRAEIDHNRKILKKYLINYLDQEKTIGGFDINLGYKFNNNISSYIGIYNYSDRETPGLLGAKAYISYNIDNIDINAEIKRDNNNGLKYILNINVNLENKRKNINGFEKHIYDKVIKEKEIVRAKTLKPCIYISNYKEIPIYYFQKDKKKDNRESKAIANNEIKESAKYIIKDPLKNVCSEIKDQKKTPKPESISNSANKVFLSFIDKSVSEGAAYFIFGDSIGGKISSGCISKTVKKWYAGDDINYLEIVTYAAASNVLATNAHNPCEYAILYGASKWSTALIVNSIGELMPYIKKSDFKASLVSIEHAFAYFILKKKYWPITAYTIAEVIPQTLNLYGINDYIVSLIY